MNFSIKKIFYPALAALILSCAACNQDPIFYAISQEVKPRPPRVAGTPTAMVAFSRQYENPHGVTERVPVVYVATSGALHWYAAPDEPETAANWEKKYGDRWWNNAKGSIKQPGGSGKILGLAVTGDYLYALYQTQLRRIKWDAPEWETINRDPSISGAISYESIFASGDKIFIGGRIAEKERPIPCTILYVDTADTTIKLLSNSGTNLLTGAAFNGTSHFLCVNNLHTSGGSIFKLDDSSFPAPAPNNLVELIKDIPFMGLISLEDDATGINHTIIAMDRRGKMYTGEGGAFTDTDKSIGRFTGALALWRDPESLEWDANDLSKKPRPKLLLAGYQGELALTTSSGYTNGYYEFDLVWNGEGKLDTEAAFHEPGKSEVSTVDNNERYLSTIRKYPINSFFQTPRDIDENMTLFASTIKEGLWSYRGRDGSPQWNAEE